MFGALRYWVLGGVLATVLAFGGGGVEAATAEIPAGLQEWGPWVLHGQEEKLCPALPAGGEARCVWPGRLTLEVDATGGRFSMAVEAFADAWLPLPGDEKRWPQQVITEQGDLPVVARSGSPQVYLPKGEHTVQGRFLWASLPELLPLPSALALVDLSVDGHRVAVPDRDEGGRLWLKQRRQGREPQQQEALQVTVFRRLVDEVPFQVESRVELQVSGSPREEVLGGGLLPGAIPMQLNSQLPARLETDGRLRVQLRPGTWWLTLRSRFPVSPGSLASSVSEGAWPASETWVFEARPNLRLVEVSGGRSIDPQQTRLPGEWRQLPAYQLQGGESLGLKEKRRGAAGQLTDRLTLQRTLWLDFDGGGYTVQDHIFGSMGRSWRLDMLEEGDLGHVSLDGRDQYVTRVGEAGRAGVEVRRGEIDLLADSRWVGSPLGMNAVGWNQVFQDVSATLHIPPGWLLLDLSGADRAPGTWLKRWTLLDLFLVLVIAISAFRLWGWRWGGLALVAIGLVWHEADAPRWLWLHLLVAAALLRLLPSGRPRLWIAWYRSLSYVLLVTVALVFMIAQVRTGLYPQLARPGQVAGAVTRVPVAQAPEPEADIAVLEERVDVMSSSLAKPGKRVAAAPVAPAASILPENDPRLQLQTGPGLPQWEWSRVPLSWNGPVGPDQRLRLLLVPPWLTLLLCLVRVALIGLLLWRVLDLEEPQGGWRRWLRPGPSRAAALILVAVLSSAQTARAEYPPEALLNQLQQRLLEPPECGLDCASIGRMHLEADPGELRLRLQVDAQARSAIPLPGESPQWRAADVLLDGRQATSLSRGASGELILIVPTGRHQVVLRGVLPSSNALLLPLPLKPHLVSWHAPGWLLEGVDTHGVPDDQLQLQRIEPQAARQERSLEPNRLPPFLRVERTLSLGLEWQVQTRVTRLTTAEQPISIDLPLLAGEAPIEELPRGAEGTVRVVLPAGTTSRGWSSLLQESSRLELVAADQTDWVEVWRLDLSPLWHAEFSGVPSIYPERPEQRYLPEWHPWPGEQVVISLSRPQGVAGQTLTIDAGRLTLTPGERSCDASFDIDLRSSQGGEHRMALPEGAELLRASIDGREQPLRQEGDELYVPVHPGGQRVELAWRQATGMGVFWSSPAFELGSRSVNARIDVKVPGDRWVLFAGGPAMGPAVLFWGVVLVVAAVGLVLGRVAWTPLRSWEWILLGLGFTQGHVVLALLVAGWLLALGWRRKLAPETRPELFNLVQVGLVLLTVVALGALCWAVQFGLLGYPDMQIAGNGSSSRLLRWYQDLAPGAFPRVWVISLPMLVYRLSMLAWSLWLAFSLLRWLTWGWGAFSSSGLWRKALRKGTFRFSSAEGKEAPHDPDPS